MSKIHTNVVDYLTQIESLTNTNLQILKTINDSFFTKKNHLFAEVNDTQYVIPSFISLENKINMLQENFENLIKSPETSEAYFNFDGNTRAIEVRKYNHTPDALTLPVISSYNVENNSIFKDFLTPKPYINFEVPTLPNDIVEVAVKKIVAKSDGVKALLKNKLSYVNTTTGENGEPIVETLYHQSVNTKYADVYKSLLQYTNGVDYEEYDTIYKLPTRKNIGTGTYIIESVVSDLIDEDLNELITLKLHNKLCYTVFDETIEKPLCVGDELINYDGTGKVVITEIRQQTNTITVKVVNGEYLNFLGTDSYDTNNGTDIHDMSKLRFNKAVDFTGDKYVKVPLEEDQFIFVAIAPVNSRMNIRAPWGVGLIVDAYGLKNNNVPFKSYYDNNVKNIGDALFEITSIISDRISDLNKDTFNSLTSISPIIDTTALSVLQINTHLNQSTSIKNIKKAYTDKKQAEKRLSDIQNQIDGVNVNLANIAFNDTSGVRLIYESQLASLNSQKSDALAAINSNMEIIALNANNSDIPIENAKYRIRGFYIPKFNTINGIDVNKHIIGLNVQYRYKNAYSLTGTAKSLSGSNDNTAYIYSDWNVMNNYLKTRTVTHNGDSYVYAFEPDNADKNEPSYNQFDIPISQGETVDIRLKVIYDFGYPFVSMTSDWSNIVNIKFPEEYTKDIPVLTIIDENNNDINNNRFNNLLNNAGVTGHVGDSLTDQNILYYHKADNIASGFYTDERRIIPLKDKLQTMTNDIAMLKNDVIGAHAACSVSLSIGDNIVDIYNDRENVITLESYNNFTKAATVDNATDKSDTKTTIGAYTYENGVVSTIININISNNGDTAIKLYSVFPGNRNVRINNTSAQLFKKDNYINGTNGGVWFKYQYGSDVNTLQTQNQFITFRTKDAWNGELYYKPNANVSTQNAQDSGKIAHLTNDTKLGMIAYPYVSTKYGLCIDSDDARSYLVINPGEQITIPVYCAFVAKMPNTKISKVLSFDLRTSLYTDPVNYTFKIIGNNSDTITDKVLFNNKKRLFDRLALPIKFRIQ